MRDTRLTFGEVSSFWLRREHESALVYLVRRCLVWLMDLCPDCRHSREHHDYLGRCDDGEAA